KIPLIGGIYADGSFEAAKLAKMHERGGASALLCFPPNSFGMGGIQRRPEMAFAHFQTIAAATDLPLIVFQYSNELAYDLDTLVKLSETIPSIRAVKDWSPAQRHERNIRVLQNLSRPINVLTTNSAWLMSALSMGAKGLLSGAGSVIATCTWPYLTPCRRMISDAPRIWQLASGTQARSFMRTRSGTCTTE